jgi:hypothetical protein
VIRDESWFHYFDLETKQESMKWHHTTSPKKTKMKTMPSVHKTLKSTFWDAEGYMLVDFFPQVENINAACYLQMCLKLHHALHDKHPGKKMIILQHDNT